MISFEDRKIMLNSGVMLDDAKIVYDYYKTEHFPKVSPVICREVDNLEGQVIGEHKYISQLDINEIYKELSPLIIKVRGKTYKAYITETMFRIVLLAETVATVEVEQ